MHVYSFAIAALLPSAVLANDWPTAKIIAPQSTPRGASDVIDHAFASFSIAIHWWRDYAGNSTSPNVFSRNLLDVLASKTGVQPQIRVGGTSADRTTYIKNQTEDVILYSAAGTPLSSGFGIPANVTIGPSFFSTYNSFPQTIFNVDLQLQRNDSAGLPNMLEAARLTVDTLGPRLASFEIGNEPDFYPSFTFNRPANYTYRDYVNEWLVRADAIAETILANNSYGLDTRLFQAGTIIYPDDEQHLLEAGVDKSARVKSMTLHYYQIGGRPYQSLSGNLMNHTVTKSNLSALVPEVAYMKKNYPDIQVVMGETNSNSANLLQDQNSGVFGSALWTIDYLLQLALAGIKRVNLHQGTTFGYSAWRPIGLDGREPFVRAPFYGIAFFDDFLGPNPNVRFAEFDMINGNPARLVAYGAYHTDVLKKVAILNLNFWNSTSTYARDSQYFEIEMPKPYNQAKIEYLCAAGGASADNGITWAGQSFNYTSAGYPYQVKNDTEYKTPGADRIVTVTLEASSAALVTFM